MKNVDNTDNTEPADEIRANTVTTLEENVNNTAVVELLSWFSQPTLILSVKSGGIQNVDCSQ